MYSLNQLPDGLIPFTTGQYIAAVIHLCLGIIGCFGSLLVILAHRTVENPPSILLMLSLNWADLYFCTTLVIFDVINIHQGGWAVGKTGCMIDSIIILAS